ncbi:MAG: DUF6054 family protein [Bacillota bacterium]
MSKISAFHISLSPKDAVEILKNSDLGEIVYEEVNRVDANKQLQVLIMQKYFYRVNNKATLVIIVDDSKGETEIRMIATAAVSGFNTGLDFGAADKYVYEVVEIMKKYSI